MTEHHVLHDVAEHIIETYVRDMHHYEHLCREPSQNKAPGRMMTHYIHFDRKKTSMPRKWRKIGQTGLSAYKNIEILLNLVRWRTQREQCGLHDQGQKICTQHCMTDVRMQICITTGPTLLRRIRSLMINMDHWPKEALTDHQLIINKCPLSPS